MVPTLTIASWKISTYALAYVLMFFVFGTWAYIRLRALGRPMELIGRRLLWVLLAGFLGAYLPVLVPTLIFYLLTGVFFWMGRERLLPGVAAGTAAAFLLWQKKRPFFQTLDLGILPFPLGMAVGRMGCFAAGCCYGAATDSWIGMYLPDESGVWAVRYPTQLMSAAANLLIFLLLVLLERWNLDRVKNGAASLFHGYLFLTFVFLFCAKRFCIEFLRYDYAPLLGPLDSTQLFCLAALVLAAGWFCVLLQRRKIFIPQQSERS